MQLLQITELVTATKYWIGLDDLENEGSFVWESGRLLSASFGRDHWADNQPNGTPSDAATLDDHCICVGCFGPKCGIRCAKMLTASSAKSYHLVSYHCRSSL